MPIVPMFKNPGLMSSVGVFFFCFEILLFNPSGLAYKKDNLLGRDH